jgi:hypothetical protein
VAELQALAKLWRNLPPCSYAARFKLEADQCELVFSDA